MASSPYESFFFNITKSLVLFYWLSIKLARVKYLQLLARCHGFPVFDISLLQKHHSLGSDRLTILGSGPSAAGFSSRNILRKKLGLTFSVGRWFFTEYPPDILFVEFNSTSMFWVDMFIAEISSRSNLLKNTIFLVEVTEASFVVHHKLRSMLPQCLYSNLYFITVIGSPGRSGYEHFFSWIHSHSLLKWLVLKSSTLLHCRSSVTIGLSIASLLEIGRVSVVGVDGYSGYFAPSSNDRFHMSGNFDNTKNRSYELHSTCNPLYGTPTVPQCFDSMSSLLDITVDSSFSILSTFLKVAPLEDL